jgi:hypothetical protein
MNGAIKPRAAVSVGFGLQVFIYFFYIDLIVIKKFDLIPTNYRSIVSSSANYKRVLTIQG